MSRQSELAQLGRIETLDADVAALKGATNV